MRIQLISDIHAEFHRDEGQSFVASLDPEGVDVLVLAGDIGNSEMFQMPLIWLCDKYPEVVFVWGNHECYGNSIEAVRKIALELAAKKSNLHVLDNTVTEIKGQRFLGATMWFRDDPLNVVYVRGMNDFYLIKSFNKTVYEENETSVKFLQENVQQGDVVVTHHIPSYSLIAKQYKGSNLNRFFVCEMDDLIIAAEPKIFFYGHTHVSTDQKIGQTRMVCNPFGYAHHEVNLDFDEKLILEI